MYLSIQLTLLKENTLLDLICLNFVYVHTIILTIEFYLILRNAVESDSFFNAFKIENLHLYQLYS